MTIDSTALAAELLQATRTTLAADFARHRSGVRRVLAEEQAVLERLARARLAGEIDDDTVVQQLRDEREMLQAVFAEGVLPNSALAREVAQQVVDAFARVLQTAMQAPAMTVATSRPGRSGRSGRNPRSGASARGTARSTARRAATLTVADRRLTVRPDTVDFRDLMYVPTLIEVGTCLTLDSYRELDVPILDQGQEGACTGFGLATVANYLLRKRKLYPDTKPVSPRMLYAMARRYDEWRGEDYEGSSCRGAMKGWQKHGVCERTLWEHEAARPDFSLTDARARDAHKRPLGAYFRVNHRDLVAMHAAICEVGVLYASASVHTGWDRVGKNGIIPFGDDVKDAGGHAFAIVAYDAKGYWIQNSWGPDWGLDGFCRISYEDWMKNGTDVWVARLGVPIDAEARSAATSNAFTVSSVAKSFAFDEVRPHIVSLGNDGQLRPGGNIGTRREDVRRLLHDDFPRITKSWKTRRLVLYAHGGLVGEEAAVQRVNDYRKAMLEAETYPLAFVWHTDYWTTLANMLGEALRLRKPEGAIDSAKDFMLDRLDDALEPIARKVTGKASWDEMKENAFAASSSRTGGVRLVLDELATLVANDPRVEVHVVAHSAGAVLMAPLVKRLTDPVEQGGLGMPIASCTLWAPACTMTLFEQMYAPAISAGRIGSFALYTLTDDAERDDNCAKIYNKSLLYLVSNALETRPRIPLFRPEGEPLLGMAKFVEQSALLRRLIAAKRVEWVRAPNTAPASQRDASRAARHGEFDDDRFTVVSTLARIRGTGRVPREANEQLQFRPGEKSLRNTRRQLDDAVRRS